MSFAQEDLQKSDISKWYAGKYVLITGGTGFMGKVLVEKLLRSCPDIKKIYLIIRYKRGFTPDERLINITKEPLFDVIRKDNPKALGKISLIQGDLAKDDLGLSEEDRDELAQNVSIVFHFAATVKFDEPLRYAVEMNIIGTELIIQLCYEMKKLEAFIYLSTAYSNCNLKEIEEKVYEPPTDLQKLKMSIECLDDEMLQELKKRLIKNRPNTYSFTKAMAENVVAVHSRNLPVAILRPAVVVSTWIEPFRGWLDGLNGPAGVLMPVGTGLLRSLIGNYHCVAEIIPVDTCINITISSAYYIAKQSKQELIVYNCVGSGSNIITWGEVVQSAVDNFQKYPLNNVMWVPNTTFTQNIFRHMFMRHVFHILPAKLIDFLLVSMAKKPMLVKAHEKIDAVIYAMAYFTSNQWYFEKKNCANLFNSLSAVDRKIFNFDFSKINWKDFMEEYAKGTKLYVMKEGPETLPVTKRRLKKLKTIYYGLYVIGFLLLGLTTYFGKDIFNCVYYFIYKLIILIAAGFYYIVNFYA